MAKTKLADLDYRIEETFAERFKQWLSQESLDSQILYSTSFAELFAADFCVTIKLANCPQYERTEVGRLGFKLFQSRHQWPVMCANFVEALSRKAWYKLAGSYDFPGV